MNVDDERARSFVAGIAIPLAALGAIALCGCKSLPPATRATAPVAGREVVVTDSEIARLSVRTAWDVLRLRAPRLVFAQDAQGQPTGVMIQARRSINSSETPLLVVDGMQMTDFSYLNSIPAGDVHLMRILDSESAEPLYGLRAAGGAVVVETKRGP